MSAKPNSARRGTLVGVIGIWVSMPGLFLCMGGLLVFGWQVSVWVKFGTWPPEPLLGVALELVQPEASWLTHPQSFYLLQWVVSWTLGRIPLSGFLIGLGLLFILAGYRIGGVPPAHDGTNAPEPLDAHLHGRNGHG